MIFRYSGDDKGHPIGVNYLEAMIRSRGRLRPPSSIDPAIKLENGYVGCTTCHDPTSQRRARLVINNERDQLCVACHDM